MTAKRKAKADRPAAGGSRPVTSGDRSETEVEEEFVNPTLSIQERFVEKLKSHPPRLTRPDSLPGSDYQKKMSGRIVASNGNGRKRGLPIVRTVGPPVTASGPAAIPGQVGRPWAGRSCGPRVYHGLRLSGSPNAKPATDAIMPSVPFAFCVLSSLFAEPTRPGAGESHYPARKSTVGEINCLWNELAPGDPFRLDSRPNTDGSRRIG